MLHHVLPQVVSNRIGVPAIRRQQPLHTIGRGIANILGQLPPILALHRSQQTLQIGQGSLSRLTTTEPSPDALVQRPQPSLPSPYFLSLRYGAAHHRPLPSRQ